MLSFTSALTRAFQKDSTRAYLALRLYYDDESAFVGFGSKPIQDGTDVYWEALSLGNFNQTTDLDKFIVSNGTINIDLPNTPKSVEGGRFSDMFSSRNFTYRKWELYQGDDGAAFSTNNLIASGIIGSDFNNTDTNFTITLNDWWLKYNIEIPLNRATKALYSNVPDKNIDEPIPMMYGDFDIEATVPATSDFERHFVKGKVPALIIDKGDTSGDIHCLADTDKVAGVILNKLNDKNVFLYNQVYQACDEANVTVSAAPANAAANLIKLTGNDFYSYFVIRRDRGVGAITVTDAANMWDNDFVTLGNIATNAPAVQTLAMEAGDVKNTGTAIAIEILFLFDNFSANDPDPAGGGGGGSAGSFFARRAGGSNVNLTWKGADYQSADITASFTSAELEGMTLSETQVNVGMDDTDNGGPADVDIKEVGLQFKVSADKTYEYKYTKQVYVGTRETSHGFIERIYEDRDTSRNIIDEIELLYISGKGREYGSWVDADSRNNGYDEGDLIENPVYIIEDILRNELGLTSSEIDYAAFDVAGNTTNGTIGDVFNDSVVDIKFAFSQHRLILAKTLIRKICKLSGLYFFWSAGKAKVVARKRTYAAVDDTIDFRDIANPSPENSSVPKPNFFMTKLENIINYITIDYDFDYAANKPINSSTPDDNGSLEDGTSQTDYNQTLKANIKFDITHDQTTAENLGIAQISYLKDRKPIIHIETTTPRYNHLENTDLVNIDSFTSNFLLFGSAISSNNIFMIIKKSLTLDGCRFDLVKLPGSV